MSRRRSLLQLRETAHREFEEFRRHVDAGREYRAALAWARVCRARRALLARTPPEERVG